MRLNRNSGKGYDGEAVTTLSVSHHVHASRADIPKDLELNGAVSRRGWWGKSDRVTTHLRFWISVDIRSSG